MIEDRVTAVRRRIARAAERVSRPPEEVALVAVSKTWPAEAVRAAFAAGVRHFGENRVQEADAKVAGLTALKANGLRWHLVGHLQSNKARKAAAPFDVIQSPPGSAQPAQPDRGLPVHGDRAGDPRHPAEAARKPKLLPARHRLSRALCSRPVCRVRDRPTDAGLRG